MARTIDDQVIKLSLDDKGLKDGIKSATKDFEDLNKHLDKTSKTDLSKLGNAKVSSSLSIVANSAKAASSAATAISKSFDENINQTIYKFPMLQAAAAVAFGGILSNAVETGLGMAKALAFDGIISGFREYELKLNSVQTILANTRSKGESIESVTAVLDDLNAYADRTVYSFSEMTRNIGTFTAAGVGLKDSAVAIKGFSNLSAAMGADAASSARGMYQLSQALASGTVKLMDWNSLQNAGLGGQGFQDALKRTARIHGEAVDEAIEKNGSFRESLKEGWLTSAVMLDTLAQMTGDLSDEQLRSQGYTEDQIAEIQAFAKEANSAAQDFKTFSQVIDASKEAIGSGWAQTWELLLGDLETAKAFWTPIGNGIGDTINAIASARNALVKGFVDAGGRNEIIATIKALFDSLAIPLSQVGKAFAEAFGGGDAVGTMMRIVTALRSLAEGFKLNALQTSLFGKVMSSVANVAKVFATVASWIVSALTSGVYAAIRFVQWFGGNLLTVLLAAGRVFEPITSALSELVSWLDLSGRAGSVASTVIEKLSEIWSGFSAAMTNAGFAWLVHPVSAFVGVTTRATEKVQEIVDAIKNFLSVASSKIPNPFSALASGGNAFIAIGEKIGTVLLRLIDIAKKIAVAIGDWLAPKIEQAKDEFEKFKASAEKSIPKSVQKQFVKMGEAVTALWHAFENLGTPEIPFEDIANRVKAALDKIKDAFVGLTGINISSILESVKNTFESLLGVFDRTDTGIENIKSKLGVRGGGLFGAAKPMLAVKKSGWEKFSEFFRSELPGSIDTGTSRVESSSGGLLSAIGGMMSKLVDYISNNSTEVAALFAQGFTIGGLFAIFKTIKGIFSRGTSVADSLSGTIGKIGGVFDTLKERIGGLQKESKPNILLKIAVALFAIAASLWILSKVDIVSIGSGLATLGTTLAGLVGAMTVINKLNIDNGGGKMAVLGLMLVGIAAAMLLISKAAQRIGKMPLGDIVKGVGAVGALNLFVTKTLKFMSSFTKRVKASVVLSFIGIAVAVNLLGIAVSKLGALKIATLVKGTIAVAAIMAAVGGMSTLMGRFGNGGGGTNAGAILAYIGIAAAVLAIGWVISKLGELDSGVLWQGLGAVGAILAGIALVSMLMGTIRDPIGTALMLAALAGTLLLAAFSLKMLADIDLSALVSTGIVLVLFIGALALVMNLMNGMVSGALSMLIVAGAVFVLALALKMLSSIPLEALGVGLLGMAAALGIVIGAGYLAEGAALGLAILAGTLLAIGFSLLLAAAAVVVFGIGLVFLSTGIMYIIGVMYTFGAAADALSGSFLNMLGLAGIMAVFGGALLFLGLGAIVAGIGFALLGAGFLMLGLGLALITATAPTAVIAIKSLVEGLNDIGIIAAGKAALVAGELGVAGIALLLFGVGSLAAAIGAAAFAAALMLLMPIMPAITPLITMFVEGLKKFGEAVQPLTDVGNAMATIAAAMVVAVSQITRFAGAIVMIAMFGNQASTAIMNLSTTIQGEFVKMAENMTTFGTSLSSSSMLISTSLSLLVTAISAAASAINSQFMQMSSVATLSLTMFTTSVTMSTSMVSTTLMSMGRTIGMASSLISVSFAAMATGTAGYMVAFRSAVAMGSVGVHGALVTIQTSVVIVSGQVVIAFASLAAGVTAAMSRLNATVRLGALSVSVSMLQIPSAINSARGMSLKAANALATGLLMTLVSRLNSSRGSVYDSAYHLGAQIPAGLASGIYNNQSSAIEAAASMARRTLARAKAELDVHSPSRKFAQVGMFVAMGLGQGIDQNTRYAVSAAGRMSNAVITSAQSIMDSISDDFNPTISPVLDLETLKSQAQGIGGIFSDPNLVPTSDIATANSLAAMKNQNGSSNGGTNVTNNSGGVTFNYVQNNTSARPLDALEIYRQTKDQIRSVKGAMRKL